MSKTPSKPLVDATLDAGQTNLADRIELRRFVGRELLLWLWLESELFEATLETKEHGQFGLWLEGRLILNEGQESTVIKGSLPGAHREAKESLLRGKMPDRAGLHLSFGDHECTLTLKGDTLSFAGLVPPKKQKDDDEPLRIDQPPPMKRKKKNADGVGAGGMPSEIVHETFYDRMHFAKDVEDLITALYRDFLAIRLSPTWDATVQPALEAWVAGKEVNADRYKTARDRAVSASKKN